MLCAERAHAREELARPDDHPTGRLQHRFDNHGRDAVAMLGQQAVEL